MNNEKIQISESVQLGIVLAIAGGFMDAYSYMCRGQVFANAQTGNIVLFGIHFAQGEWKIALSYFLPVMSFAIGIAFASVARLKLKNKQVILHWRQITVLLEIIILSGVAFMPQSINLVANSITSLACGIQVESFRKINGNAIATTMCIGNLRSGTNALCEYFVTKNNKYKSECILYYGIIGMFLTGAIIGNQFIRFMNTKAILPCAFLLLLGFIMMFMEKDNKKSKIH